MAQPPKPAPRPSTPPPPQQQPPQQQPHPGVQQPPHQQPHPGVQQQPPPPQQPPPDDRDHKDAAGNKHGKDLHPDEKLPAVMGGQITKHGDEERDRQRPTIGVKGEPIEDGERDPDTIAEEQRRRSADMEAKGIKAWLEEHDERTREQKEGHPRVEGAQGRLEDHRAA